MNIRRLLHAPHGVLRAPWRIALFALASGAAYVVLTTLVATVVVTLPLGQQQIVAYWLLTLALLIGHGVSVVWVDNRTLEEVGLNRRAARPGLLVRGLLLGTVAIGVPCAVLLNAEWLRVEPTAPGSWWAEAGRMALFLAPAAATEELLLRGYIFSVLCEVWGWRKTLVGTSVVFGLLHIANLQKLGWPMVGVQAILVVILAGIFLGGILVATHSLYAAWAAHFAWNWVMAAVLHTPVSGFGFGAPSYRVVDAGPDWATGGGWGPEAGVGAVLGLAAGAAYLYYFAVRVARVRRDDLFTRRRRREET